MKRTCKKSLALLLTLVMVLSLMPALTLPAAAVAGTRTEPLNLLTQTTDVDNMSTEGWSWVYSTKTLTLNGLNLVTSTTVSADATPNYTHGIALAVPDGTTIVLEEGSTNVVKHTGSPTIASFGLLCLKEGKAVYETAVTPNDANADYGSLTIIGNGTLTVEAADVNLTANENQNIYSVGMSGNTITIGDDSSAPVVSAQAGKSIATLNGGGKAAFTHGIQANTLTMYDGQVTGKSNYLSRPEGNRQIIDVYATTANIYGGTLSAISGSSVAHPNKIGMLNILYYGFYIRDSLIFIQDGATEKAGTVISSIGDTPANPSGPQRTAIYVQATLGNVRGNIECTGATNNTIPATGRVTLTQADASTPVTLTETIPRDPAITVGAQSAKPLRGTAGSAAYTVTATNFGGQLPAFAPSISWTGGAAPEGVSAELNDANTQLTITTTTDTPAGSYKFKVVSDTYQSAEATLLVNEKLTDVGYSVKNGNLTNTTENMEYNLDGLAWLACTAPSTSVSFSAGNTVKVRDKNDTAHQRTIATIPAVSVAPTPFELEALSFNVKEGTISGLDDTYEWSIGSSGPWSTDATGITFTAGTLNIRRVATHTILPSASAVLATIAAAVTPSAPTIGTGADAPTASSITVETVQGNEYCITDSATPDWTNSFIESETTGTKKFDNLDSATQYYIHVRIPATDSALASAVANVSQYTAAATPEADEGYTINYAAETITIADDKYEIYSAQTGGDKIADSSTTNKSGSISAYLGQSVYIRVKATSNYDASAWTAIALAARPAAPVTPAVPKRSDVTNVSITIPVTGGNEYLVNTSSIAPADWTGSFEASSDADHEFTSLTAGTDYYIHVRKAATDEAPASTAATSADFKTKTAPAAISTLTAPIISGDTPRTASSIAVSTKAGQEYFISTDSTAPTSWAGSGFLPASEADGSHSFDGLDPATRYYIHYRAAGTNDAMPSLPGSINTYTLPLTPVAGDFTVTQPTSTSGDASKGAIVVAEGKTAADYEYRVKTGTDTWGPWTGLPTDGLSAIEAPATYEFRVKADDATPASDALTVTINKYSPPSSGGGTTPTTPTAGVVIDGKTENVGKTETTATETTVVIDANKLTPKIEAASEGSDVIVSVPDKKPASTVQLVVENVEDMAQKNMTLVVETGGVDYSIPASAIDTAAIRSELGATDPAEVPVSVTIKQTGDKPTIEGATVVIPAVEFIVTATFGGKTVEVEVFDRYVSRTVEVTEEQAKQITTAIVYEADGSVRHVPTEVFTKDGKWYARANSLTNSTYVFISNEQSFTDAAGKWFEDIVNEMAGRKIINGRGEGVFDGEASITRAEFAAIVVRALGLPEDGDASAFSDVASGAWYYGAVGKAYEYGLINGRGNGIFDPMANITRQEAMAMVHRAAAITEHAGTTGSLSAFTDADSISSWALEDAKWNVGSGLIQGKGNGLICGQDNISRAETATIILRLLQKSELVDVRTEA